MRWGNEMGANPFAPLIENTFLRSLCTATHPPREKIGEGRL